MNELRANKVVGEFLDGLDYPITKAEILQRAHDAKIGASVQEALQNLPDREYVDAGDVGGSLNAQV